MKSIKSIRKQFKAEGVFYTDEKLTKKLYSYVDTPYKSVYDPTCGQGNLLAFASDEAMKYGQDIDGEEVEKAKSRLKNFHGAVGDTLKEPAFLDQRFDLIIANPPFSIKYDAESLKDDERFKELEVMPPNSKADFAFIFHMLYLLKETGMIVTLQFPGVLYRGQREGKLRKYLVEKNYVDKVISVPGNSFEDTTIQTVILVLRKNKKTTDIHFEDLELNMSRDVKIDEIKDNDYDLSVNRYIHEEKVIEKIDPLALNESIREKTLANLKIKIEWDFLVNSIDPDLKNDSKSFVQDIIDLASSFLERDEIALTPLSKRNESKNA